jgi:hypothetical protein
LETNRQFGLKSHVKNPSTESNALARTGGKILGVPLI